MDTSCPIRWANIARGHLRSKFRDPSWAELPVPFCPYIMGTVHRGHTDCPAPSGSCSMPSLTEEDGGAWNNINCVVCQELTGLNDLRGFELILDLIIVSLWSWDFWLEWDFRPQRDSDKMLVQSCNSVKNCCTVIKMWERMQNLNFSLQLIFYCFYVYDRVQHHESFCGAVCAVLFPVVWYGFLSHLQVWPFGTSINTFAFRWHFVQTSFVWSILNCFFYFTVLRLFLVFWPFWP